MPCYTGMSLKGFIPWILSERQSCSVLSTHSPRSEGVPWFLAALWGPFPAGTPQLFLAGVWDSATQPPAKSWLLQAFKSEKISLNAERGVSLILNRAGDS